MSKEEILEEEDYEESEEIMEDEDATADLTHSPLKHHAKPIELLEYLLSHPSVDLELKKSFIAFWELVPLGNYTEWDIKKLYNMFELYINHMLMDIPDDEWNAMINYSNGNMSMNQLIAILKQAFYIQLTRGRQGFLTKELGTIRTGRAEAVQEPPKKKGWFG